MTSALLNVCDPGFKLAAVTEARMRRCVNPEAEWALFLAQYNDTHCIREKKVDYRVRPIDGPWF